MVGYRNLDLLGMDRPGARPADEGREDVPLNASSVKLKIIDRGHRESVPVRICEDE